MQLVVMTLSAALLRVWNHPAGAQYHHSSENRWRMVSMHSLACQGVVMKAGGFWLPNRVLDLVPLYLAVVFGLLVSCLKMVETLE